MKKLILLGFLCFLYGHISRAQSTFNIRGKTLDAISKKPIEEVVVTIKNTKFITETDLNGSFLIENIPINNFVLLITREDYTSIKIPITVNEINSIDLGIIYLENSTLERQDNSLISLTDDDLLDDGNSNSDYTAGLFQSSKDAYLKAASFNFSQAWFKVRGYDSGYGSILINGIEMNKLYDGRPQWSNWGGLNDAFRNQEFSDGIKASENNFGGILGSTNFITRASESRQGGKISYASANKSYNGRVMATYATGLNKKGWALVVSGSRRFAQEGYLEGTTYNAWASFIAAEKKFNSNHSLNLTAFVAPNRRGKSSPNTQEVYDLKGLKYNAYWGKQEGDLRNSRMKEIVEPVLMLSHFFEKDKTTLKTTVAYQFGHIGNSRLGYFNAPNPDPTYWKYLPSSFLRFQDDLDYSNAYLTEQEFLNNGQLNWKNLYQVNADNGNSLYYLYEDRVDDKQLSFSSVLASNLNDNLNLNVGVSFKNLVSNNYANMLDLLGGNGFMDLDQYAEGTAQQNDLNNLNNLVGVNDEFQYNYTINASIVNAFAQLQFSQKKADYFIALNYKNTNYQREGLYRNGTYSDSSFGKGEKQSFSDFSAKGGVTYKITGRHLLSANGAYVSNAPTIRTAFSNSRVNNNITPNLTSEKIIAGDVNYIFRLSKIQSRITAFYTKFSNGIETSFFFAEGLLGDQADFVNEITTGVDKRNIGAELSFEYQVIPTVKLILAGSIGQYTYDNNPQLYLQSESLRDENSDFGTTYLKNYRISGTPQRAYSLGFEYRDPNYWWFQINGNLLSHNYLDITPLLRTDNFYLDTDKVSFLDEETGVEVSQEQVNTLLKQEKFDDAFLMNLVGGKSWKIDDYYFGFFLGVNNVLSEVFKTGGFEQARNANYPELKQDRELNKPIFGSKYWYGSKASYYLNLYVRF
ncbi:TonB-dependent receptor [Lutibacter flavus]|uniref:CarboxypepD_reg-like domain-containing protein n=1 Tax=Lutibacter flavus TaxID=691689 RepID=A0A238X651_9FLAO|nr:TonB-dependent receptor [Lutibacter flavus]SNR54102.1 CarboxypepD_reg-like domain-containing protein [Lutibacter flavus]